MWIALAVLAALEAGAPPAVTLTRTGSAGAPVSAAPRSLSDVAREIRDGRRAVGGFSAVETTVSRGPLVLPSLEWAGDEARSGPEVVDQPEPPGDAVPYAPGWVGGWFGGAPGPRHPHPHPVVRPPARHVVRPGAGPSPRPAAPDGRRAAARVPGGGRMRGGF